LCSFIKPGPVCRRCTMGFCWSMFTPVARRVCAPCYCFTTCAVFFSLCAGEKVIGLKVFFRQGQCLDAGAWLDPEEGEAFERDTNRKRCVLCRLVVGHSGLTACVWNWTLNGTISDILMALTIVNPQSENSPVSLWFLSIISSKHLW
jgi:hypothetical protein